MYPRLLREFALRRRADELIILTAAGGCEKPAQALQKALRIGDIDAAVLLGKRLLGPLKMRPRPPGYVPAVSGEIVMRLSSPQISEPE